MTSLTWILQGKMKILVNICRTHTHICIVSTQHDTCIVVGWVKSPYNIAFNKEGKKLTLYLMKGEAAEGAKEKSELFCLV